MNTLPLPPMNTLHLPYSTVSLDANIDENATHSVALGGADRASFQVVVNTGAFSAAVLSFQVSLDGVSWFDLSTPVTLNAAGIKYGIDVKGVPFCRVAVTTANGAALDVRVRIYANKYGS